MAWTWFFKATTAAQPPGWNVTHEFVEDGVLFRTTAPTEEPFWLHDPHAFGPLAETVALLAQLEEGGLAIARESALFLSWECLYELKRSPVYGAGLELLGLPPGKRLTPSLGYQGAMSDPDFLITVDRWLDECGLPFGYSPDVVGAVAIIDGKPFLLPEPCWRAVSAVRDFCRLSPADKKPDTNRRAWAVVRRHAVEAGAQLAHFLLNTVVLTPERLRLGLRKAKFGDTTMVEIQPSFDGAPDRWLEFFDNPQTVEDLYNIPTGEGMVQVVIEPRVKRVLEEIKRMPGRRVAGSRAEAFISNPFAALGDDAAAVIDEKEFEAARVDAGLNYQRFTAHVERDGFGYPTNVGLFIEEVLEDTVRAESYEFPDEAALEKFVRRLEAALNSGYQLLAWEGFDLELLGDTPEQLATLKKTLEDWRGPRVAIRYADVYDISRYSERVESIGVEKPYYSPFIAKKGEEWFPENVVFGIWHTPEGENEPVALALNEKQLETFRERLNEAEDKNLASFEFPGCPKPVSIHDAKNILSDFVDAFKDIHERKFPSVGKGRKEAGEKERKTLILRANIQSVDYQEARKDALAHDATRPPRLPVALRREYGLKDHQLQGVAWLQHIWSQAPAYCRGAVLADDMGLGKTVQLLTFIARCHEDNENLEPALVVAPVSLLENWIDEIQKFFARDALTVLTLYGETLRDKKLSYDHIDQRLLDEGISRFLKPDWAKGAKIILTTYETLRDLEFSLAAEQWSIMVCDEAQRIKNPNAMVTRAAKKQKVRFKIACTGTPVENTLTDLWCLFDFVQPGLLGALNDFGARYRKPIEAETEEEKARVGELRAIIAPQILRRLKSEVAKDLPKKHERREALQLSNKQRALYSNAISLFRQRDEADPIFQNHLGLLHYLRRICTDPRPIGQQAHLGDSLDLYTKGAPKMAWLMETLEEVQRRDEKAIIFVEFRDIQRLVQHYIRERFGFSPDIINGDTEASAAHSNSRHKRIKAFQGKRGFSTIILSPLAVGFGVNIQAANHVIHYTRTWNPAKEDQATDRAHRIGQEKDVFVYYPVVEAEDFKTFDKKLDELLGWKRGLSKDMLNGCGDLRPTDFGDLEGVTGADVFSSGPLTMEDVLSMEADTFECFCAALWAKQKYPKVYRTPQSGDGGIDVVAIRGREGVLIQCKSSMIDGNQLGWDAIKDVVTGAAAYEKRHPGVKFLKLAAINQFFNGTARYQAQLNSVELVDRDRLADLLAQYHVTRFEVEQYLVTDWAANA